MVVKYEHMDRQKCALTTSTYGTYGKVTSILQLKT